MHVGSVGPREMWASWNASVGSSLCASCTTMRSSETAVVSAICNRPLSPTITHLSPPANTIGLSRSPLERMSRTTRPTPSRITAAMKMAGPRVPATALNAGLFPANAGESHTFGVIDRGSTTERTVPMTSANVVNVPVQHVQTIDTGASGKVGYMLVPKGPGGQIPPTYTSAVAVSARSKNPGAAFLFAQWLTGKTVGIKQQLGGVGVARLSTWDDPKVKENAAMPKDG